MRFWEEEVQKYNRRLKKIAERPDRTKLASNKLLYEIWKSRRQQQLAAWDAGEPFAYTGGMIPFRLTRAMGLNSCSIGIEGDRTGSAAEKYFATVRELGYPEHGCDRIMAGMGIVLSGEMPPPAIVLAASYPCGPEHLSVTALGRTYRCPSFAIDVPAINDDWALSYVVKQLENMIRFIETEIPGTKYDEESLVRFQGLWGRQHKCLREVYELKKAVPCPLAAIDTFRLPPFEIVDDPLVAEYAEMYRDELADRVKRGWGAVPEEKLRIGWLVSGPFVADPWSLMAEMGVAMPYFEFGMSGYVFGFGQSDPWKERSARGELTPLEEEARFALCNSWNGPAERRVADVLTVTRDLKLDALVHYQLWGCSNLLASSRLIADRALEELGVTSLFIEGSSLDWAKLDMGRIEAQLRVFIDMNVEKRKQ